MVTSLTLLTWQSHHVIAVAENLVLHTNFMALVFYRTRVIADRSFTLQEYRFFFTFLLLWLWLWPDDFHIGTWPIIPGGIPEMGIWTSYIKAFESYRLTDIHTDRRPDTIEIIYRATSCMVNNSVHISTPLYKVITSVAVLLPPSWRKHSD